MPQTSTTHQILSNLPPSSSSSSSSSSLPPVTNDANPKPPAFPGQDCMLVGASAFTGLGAYSLYQAQAQGAFSKVRPKGSPVLAGQITAVLGTVFLGLGVGRLFI